MAHRISICYERPIDDAPGETRKRINRLAIGIPKFTKQLYRTHSIIPTKVEINIAAPGPHLQIIK